jgi:hypothetical protein
MVALSPGSDGLAIIQRQLMIASVHSKEGHLLLEIGRSKWGGEGTGC